jgi:hypothetical protein
LRGQPSERGPGGQHRQPQRAAVGPADQARQRPGGQVLPRRAGQLAKAINVLQTRETGRLETFKEV